MIDNKTYTVDDLKDLDNTETEEEKPTSTPNTPTANLVHTEKEITRKTESKQVPEARKIDINKYKQTKFEKISQKYKPRIRSR